MSLTVKLATFSKRENSTKQYNSTWTDFNCVLKEGCSIINPRIELQTSTDIHALNYAYIADFGRYYFVRDFTYYRDSIMLTLECDVLATYKSQIGSSSEYILRSASSYDGDVVDTLYPTKTDNTIQVGSSVAVFNPSDITYIIGILNNETTNKAGAVQYLAMNSTQLGDLMRFLLGIDAPQEMDSFVQTMSTLSTMVQDGVARSLINPTQYIVESYALPYSADVGSLATVKCGWWTLALTAYTVKPRTNHITIKSGSLLLPPHPQAGTVGHYLSGAPYTRYTLNLGPFGIYPLDATKAINASTVDFEVYGDNFGNVTCELSLNGVIIDKLTTCVKCPFAVGQVSIDALGAINNGVSMAVAGVGGFNSDPASIVGATGAIASNITSSINSLLPQVNRQGSQGNFSNVFPNFESVGEHYLIVDTDNTHRGRPLCKVQTISSLSGYILVSDADIATAGTKEETQIIKNYMNSGFYYE